MNRPQKMAYLVSLYPAFSHTFILREVRLLRALGHEIVTASVNRADASAMGPQEQAEAERTFFIKQQGLLGAVRALLYWLLHAPLRLLAMLLAAPRLAPAGRRWLGLAYAVEAALVARWMQREQTTLLHVHFGNAAASVGVLTRRLSGCHLSMTVHGPDEFDDVQGQHLRDKMAEADAVVCISQQVQAQLMRLSDPQHWHKLKLCRLGVAMDEFQFNQRRGSGPMQLLCVGRLTPAKGQIVLVQAVAELLRRGQPCRLTLVGEGPDRPRIEAAIATAGLQGVVQLTGALPQAAVRDWMARADLFVLPSLAEGIPVVLMEAMASGLPCVSTPVNGIPELIDSPQVGRLAMPGDVLSLADRLQDLMGQPELCDAISIAAYYKLQQDFDLRRNVEALSRLFRSFPAQRVPPVLPCAAQMRGVS